MDCNNNVSDSMSNSDANCNADREHPSSTTNRLDEVKKSGNANPPPQHCDNKCKSTNNSKATPTSCTAALTKNKSPPLGDGQEAKEVSPPLPLANPSVEVSTSRAVAMTSTSVSVCVSATTATTATTKTQRMATSNGLLQQTYPSITPTYWQPVHNPAPYLLPGN